MALAERVWTRYGLGRSSSWSLGLSLGLGFGLSMGCGWAQTLGQTSLPTSPQTSEDALHGMAQLAGVIFTGQVVAVRRHQAAAGSGAAGVVEIEFAVEDAVRGVRGGTYTLREWAGLWPGGDEPFRVGQRYLMLLHSPGAAGLSSPIGGMDGAIPIRGAIAAASAAVGQESAGPESAGPTNKMATNGSSAGGSTQADSRVMDLSWVGTRVVRPVSYASATTIGPRPIFLQSSSPNAAGSAPRTVARVAPALAGAEATTAPASQSAAYTTVLGMLRNWETEDHGAR
jgi:hypothetical protein